MKKGGIDMEEYQIIFMRIREYFRKSAKTNWGKIQIISMLDDMEEKVRIEKEE